MNRTIVVAGVGQLGSRYLQGLSNYPIPLNILAFDISDKSLSNAHLRWKEAMPASHHSLLLSSDINDLPPNVDLVIVSSTASNRAALVYKLSNVLASPYWLLEKVLATSVDDLLKIKNCLNGAMAWVNTPRMYMPLYHQLSHYLHGKICHIDYFNMSGIACNAIHLIDYFSRSLTTDIASVDPSGLSNWEASKKRPSTFEVSGDLCISYGNGSSLKIHGSPFGSLLAKAFTISIIDSFPEVWCVYPSQNIAFSNRGESIEGLSVLYQSEITSTIVDDIFNSQSPLLPTLDQSLSQHLPFINALVSHWCDNMNLSSYVPIT